MSTINTIPRLAMLWTAGLTTSILFFPGK